MSRPGASALLLLALTLASPSHAAPGDAPGDTVTLVGEFVDPVCLFQHGMQGKLGRECALVSGRLEQGIHFLDIRQRRLYTVIGQNHWEDPRAGFLEALGDTFAIQGQVWRHGDSRAIAIHAMHPYRGQPEARFALWPWHWEWSVLLGCGLLATLFALALTVWRARLGAPDRRFEAGRAALFLAGLLVVVFSLNGPMHDLSDQYFFSAHMIQHLLLAQVFPILLVLGVPPWLRRTLVRTPFLGPAFSLLAMAPLGFLLYTVVFSIWHVPVLYNLMMREHSFHIAMHLMVMATATLMWWPVVGGDAVRRPLGSGLQMLYLFLLGIPMMAVAAPIVFSQEPLYEWYRFAPPLWGQTPLEDQRLGGLIMWVPGGLYYWGVMTVVYFLWSQREHRTDDPFAIPGVPNHS